MSYAFIIASNSFALIKNITKYLIMVFLVFFVIFKYID